MKSQNLSYNVGCTDAFIGKMLKRRTIRLLEQHYVKISKIFSMI